MEISINKFSLTIFLVYENWFDFNSNLMGLSHIHFEILGGNTLSFFMAVKKCTLGLNFCYKFKNWKGFLYPSYIIWGTFLRNLVPHCSYSFKHLLGLVPSNKWIQSNHELFLKISLWIIRLFFHLVYNICI